MPSIFRVSRPDSDDVTDVGSVEAIEPAMRRSDEPGRFQVDVISHDPLSSGHTSRRWGIVTKHPDGTVAVEPDPWGC